MTLFPVFSVCNLALCTCQGNLCVSVWTSHHAVTLAGLGYESMWGSDPGCFWYQGSSTVCRMSSLLLGEGYFCRLEPFRRSLHEDLCSLVLQWRWFCWPSQWIPQPVLVLLSEWVWQVWFLCNTALMIDKSSAWCWLSLTRIVIVMLI